MFVTQVLQKLKQEEGKYYPALPRKKKGGGEVMHWLANSMFIK